MVIDSNYKKALVEVEAVLDCLNIEDYNKIPKEIINKIKENKDQAYKYEYDKSLQFDRWNFMDETKAILYNLSKKYLISEEERLKLIQHEITEQNKIEDEKKKKYDANDLFKTEYAKDDTAKSIETTETSLRKESPIKKFFVRIKNFLFGQ